MIFALELLEKKNLHIFDSTAVLEVPKFATRVQSTITPPWREYSRLTGGPDIPREIREKAEVKIALKDATETVFAWLNGSNVHSQEHEAFQDLAIGTGAMNFWQGDIGGKPFLFDAVPLNELILEEGPQSTIESTWRDMSIVVQHIKRLYPGAELSKEQEELRAEHPGEKVPLIEGVLYDPQTERTFGVLIDIKKPEHARIMWQTFWPVSPRQVFRWSVAPGELYGRGPIMLILPDIKTANKVVEFILRSAALAVSGVYTSTGDSAVNPYTMRIAPGSVIPVQSNSNVNPTIRALERNADIGLGFEVLAALQTNIREALLSSPQFNLDDNPVQTATAWAIADRRNIQEVGSSYGRLQTELVERRIARAVQILGDQARIPPIRVDGRNVTLKHQSPLARAQDQDELFTMQQGIDMLTPLGPEVLAMGIKIEDLAAWVGEKLGYDPRLIRSEDERQAIKQQASEVINDNREALPAAA